MFADFVADMLFADESGMDRLLNELDKPTRVKFIEWILDILDGFKAVFSEEAKQIRKIKRLEKKFAKLLTETKTVKNDGNNKQYYLEIENVVKKAIENKGKIDEPRNQKQISKVPDELAKMVLKATNGKIDISEKYIAVNASDVYHEYINHSNEEIESKSRGQKALTPEIIAEMIQSIYEPDIIEGLITETNNKTQRQSFAYVKKKDGYYVIAEVVGGRKNPNITPSMMLYITEERWNKNINEGKIIGEMLYKSNLKMLELLDTSTNKNNRVTAAKHQATDVSTAPHSPRSNDTVPQTKPSVKQFSLEETDRQYLSSERFKADNKDFRYSLEENETRPFKEAIAEIGKEKTGSSEALNAYSNGYMPKSLWDKKMFVYAIHEINHLIILLLFLFFINLPFCGTQNFYGRFAFLLKILTAATQYFRFIIHWMRSNIAPSGFDSPCYTTE